MTAMASFRSFAAHDLRLAWRDWSWLLSARYKLHAVAIAAVVLALVVGLHGLAYYVLQDRFASDFALSKVAHLIITGTALLIFTMMLSQAVEMVTRAFYVRDDLELIMSSPAPAGDLFAMRLVLLAASSAVLSLLYVAPFINVAIYLDGWHWVGAYAVVLSFAMISTALATCLVLALFAMIGPRRTRLVAQIVAAVVSAVFLIGIQAFAILGFGTVSRLTVLSSPWLQSITPDAASYLWFISFAAVGEPIYVVSCMGFAAVTLVIAAYLGSIRFRQHVLSAASVSDSAVAAPHKPSSFCVHSRRTALILKEWKLLARDPWLVSQTLLQFLYLIPPGLMLWVTYGDNNPIFVVVGPVIVMALSQLAGGLAWLVLSGEDAADLLQSSPMSSMDRAVAKVCAVILLVVGIAFPLLIAMSFVSLTGAVFSGIGIMVGASCTTIIQMLFHIPAKRSMFRRRQVASKVATFSEAFAAITCAAATGLVIAGAYGMVAIPSLSLVLIMGTAWLFRVPRP